MKEIFFMEVNHSDPMQNQVRFEKAFESMPDGQYRIVHEDNIQRMINDVRKTLRVYAVNPDHNEHVSALVCKILYIMTHYGVGIHPTHFQGSEEL
jgi:hypothetical protein